MGKYEEALERAKQGLPIDEVFPELKESEDERIRKWLVEYFKPVSKSWIHRDMSPEQVIAYLEKQKEQKPAEWSEEDEHYFQNLIMAVDSTFSEGNTKNWLQNRFKSLRPQPHWKPSEEQMEALNSIILTGSFTYVGQTQDLISLKDELKKLI